MSDFVEVDVEEVESKAREILEAISASVLGASRRKSSTHEVWGLGLHAAIRALAAASMRDDRVPDIQELVDSLARGIHIQPAPAGDPN